jgi:hypothetical protein
VDEQLFVFLAFLRKAMFLGIHPDIFHVVGKIVFISYPMVHKSCLPDGLAFFLLMKSVDIFESILQLKTKAIIRFEVASPMVGPPYVAALWS